jgi:hypothetical protein
MILPHTPSLHTSSPFTIVSSLPHRDHWIAYAIFRFALSFRDVEEMMANRGLPLTYETVREWKLKFGQTYGASG